MDRWLTQRKSVAGLLLDERNPRLSDAGQSRAPREIIQYLFQHDKAAEVADSIARRGYFPNEPLLAVPDDGRLIVVEGNRRLAALKALRDSSLLDAPYQGQIERLVRRYTQHDCKHRVLFQEMEARRIACAEERLVRP